MRRSWTHPGSSSLALCLLVLIGAAGPVLAQVVPDDREPIMKVRIPWPSAGQAAQLRGMADLEPMHIAPGEEIILASDAEQVARLEQLGLRVEILVPDLQAYYIARRSGHRDYGPFYTYAEAVAQLDGLHAQYPAITTEKFSIGTTFEGRTIWAMKVSDNPGIDEAEPEVLFDAAHHAREPMGVSILIETIRRLGEGYGSDPEITYLVDNREIWFVPLLNPDGYVYNQQIAPDGGGMWRKNRRINEGSACRGVDLNRNYPFMWGYSGVSFDPCEDNYLGPEPNSELEVQALMQLCVARQFITHFSYHSVAGTYLVPWSYDVDVKTPDDARFRAFGERLATWNGYAVGQPGEVLGYDCSGTSTDWTYAEQILKPKTFSYGVEVGGSDFWPMDDEVPWLIESNVPANLELIKAADGYPAVVGCRLSGGDGDETPDPGETLSLVVTVENASPFAQMGPTEAIVTSDDAYVSLGSAAVSFLSVAPGRRTSNNQQPFVFTIDPACPAGHTLTLTIMVDLNGYKAVQNRVWSVGDLPEVFTDDVEGGENGWTHAALTLHYADQWHQDIYRNHTTGGTTSWKFGQYASGDYASYSDGALISPSIPVASTCELRFWHWMDAEALQGVSGLAYDGGLIEVSRDGGPWEQATPALGYTHTILDGGGLGPFPEGTPVFSGSFDWREDWIVIQGGAQSLRFRFRFGSDSVVGGEGWYIDDVRLLAMGPQNAPPTAPQLVGPVEGEVLGVPAPTLIVANASDPDPQTLLAYGFRVFRDELLTDPVAAVDGIAEGAGTTSWTLPVWLADGDYYWQAYADDGTERGPCMPRARFEIATGGASVEAPPMARGLHLLGPAPTPAPGWTDLRMRIEVAGVVEGAIYDLQGRRVRSLRMSAQGGEQRLRWDGNDDRGRPVATGLYLYELRTADQRAAGRLMLVR
jgi:hypothetical protein